MPDHIPFEIQVEIIKRLPVKSLIRSRSVSKPWKSLIDSSNFIAAYSLHGPAQPRHLLIRYEYLPSGEKYESIIDDEAFPQNKFPLTVPSSVNLLKDSNVIGTSHGLVCMFGYYRNPSDLDFRSGTPMAVLWNPSIRKSVAVPVPDVDRSLWGISLGFGVCPATSDPKIVKIKDTTCSSRWQVEVFSLSSGVWRSSIGNLPSNSVFYIRAFSQVIVDRFIYLFAVVSGFNLLISFDLSSEEFREVYFPDELAFHEEDLYIFKRIDSLAVLQEWMRGDIYDVWMMENGDLKSFTKLFSINLSYISGDCLPTEFRRNGELMMARIDDADNIDALMVFEPFSEQIIDLGIIDQFNSLLVSSYTESLILLDLSDTLVDGEDDEEMSV